MGAALHFSDRILPIFTHYERHSNHLWPKIGFICLLKRTPPNTAASLVLLEAGVRVDRVSVGCCLIVHKTAMVFFPCMRSPVL